MDPRIPTMPHQRLRCRLRRKADRLNLSDNWTAMLNAGRPAFKVGAWFGYERPPWNGHGKWHLQLNARRLIDEQGLIPVRTRPAGEVAVYRVAEPRLWSLSSRFVFQTR